MRYLWIFLLYRLFGNNGLIFKIRAGRRLNWKLIGKPRSERRRFEAAPISIIGASCAGLTQLGVVSVIELIYPNLAEITILPM